MIRTFSKGLFRIDSVAGTFEGYTSGERWNGWVCPYFERETAEQILMLSEGNGYQWSYDSVQDAYLVSHEEDLLDFEPEVFAGMQIQVGDSKKTVYPIGAYSWVWESADSGDQ